MVDEMVDEIRAAEAYPEHATTDTPEARSLHALRNALSSLVMATYDGTIPRANMRDVIIEHVVPELDRVADLFERQERTIEEQRVEILRLQRFTERAEARDTKNQQQLIAAQKLRDGLMASLTSLIPKLESLAHAMHDLELDQRSAPLLR